MFGVTSEQKKSQKDVEYIVRLISHTFSDYDRRLEVQEFLDHTIVDILIDRNHEDVMPTITWTMETLHRLLGARALVPPDNAPQNVASRFSLRALEAIAVGISRNRDSIMAHSNSDQFIIKKIDEFWKQPEVAQMSVAGLRGTQRLQRTIPFGDKWFNPNV